MRAVTADGKGIVSPALCVRSVRARVETAGTGPFGGPSNRWGRRTRVRRLRGVVVAALAAAALSACGAAQATRNGAKGTRAAPIVPASASASAVSPSSAPVPGAPYSLHDALTLTLPEYFGRGSTLTTAQVQSIRYVQTVAGKALSLLQESSRGISEPTQAEGWLVVATGTFQSDRTGCHCTPVYHLIWDLAVQGQPGVLQGEMPAPSLDLAAFGTVETLPPAQWNAFD